MLQNAYFLAKIGADTAENEQQFAEILPIDRRVLDRAAACGGARRRPGAVRGGAQRRARPRGLGAPAARALVHRQVL